MTAEFQLFGQTVSVGELDSLILTINSQFLHRMETWQVERPTSPRFSKKHILDCRNSVEKWKTVACSCLFPLLETQFPRVLRTTTSSNDSKHTNLISNWDLGRADQETEFQDAKRETSRTFREHAKKYIQMRMAIGSKC